MKLFAVLRLFTCLLSLSIASPTTNAAAKRQESRQRASKHLRPNYEKRQSFDQGEPINAKGNGAPILGEHETCGEVIFGRCQ